jgi:prophage regulatory protein
MASAHTQTIKTRQKITYRPGPLPNEGCVRLPSVLAFLGISKSSFLNGIKDGLYPPGILLGPKTRVWPVEEIRAIPEKIKGASK